MKRLLLFLWAGCAALCLCGAYALYPGAAPVLPLPTVVEQVEIVRADLTLTLHAAPEWQIDGHAAPRFAPWLQQLRYGCDRSYPLDDITLPEDDGRITLRFNGGEEWHFSAHNAYSRRHYLIHETTAYLCDEQLKPRLTLPAAYWRGDDTQ